MALFDNLEWKLTAEDKASGTFNKVAVSADKLGDASSRMSTQMDGGANSWMNIAKGVLAGGAAFAVAQQALGFLTNQVTLSIQEAANYQREQALLNTVLESTGHAAGLTREELNLMADELAASTAIAGGEINNVQSMLLSFTKIGKDSFQEVTAAVLDYATFMNQGGIPSTEALKAAAIQLGKAMQDPIKGVAALSKSGVQLSDSQIDLIETMMETNDVAGAQEVILGELATQTAGQASAAAQTFEGRLAKMNEAVNNVREKIGLALMPTLSMLVDEMTDTAGSVKVSDETMKKWQRRIFETVGGLKTWIVIGGGFIGVVIAIAKVFLEASHIVMGVMTDWVKGIINIKQNATNAFTAIKQALTGDFGGALETMKSGFTSVFQTTIGEVHDFAGALSGVGTAITDGMETAKNAVLKFHEQRMGFDEMADAMNETAGAGAGIGDGVSEGAAKAEEAQKKIEESVAKMEEDYIAARESISTELMKLEESHAKEVEKIKGKLEDLQLTLTETTDAYKKAMGEINNTEAEGVVEQEQAIADLKEQIAELREGGGEEGLSVDDEKQLATLEAQLASETAAYQAYITERTGLDAELTEARRRASLTDFERFIEDINLKRAEEQTAYDAKLAEIQGEVLAQQTALAEENTVYEAKKAMYAAVDAAFQEFHDNYLANLSSMGAYTASTVSVMEAELARIIKLFSQIKDLRASAGLNGVNLGSPGEGLSGGTDAPAGDTVTNQVTNNITIQVQGDNAAAASLVTEIQRQLELAGLASS